MTRSSVGSVGRGIPVRDATESEVMDDLSIFVSWSGPLARDVATLLRDLLTHASDRFKPWMSEWDIPSGGRGLETIASQLSSTSVGLVIVTRDNQAAPWLNFEAGALSKQVSEVSRVIPLLVDLDGTELASGPLTQFQYRQLDHDGLLRVVVDLAHLAGAVESSVVSRVEDRWSAFEGELSTVVKSRSNGPAPRSDRDLIADMHGDVRLLLRTAGMTVTSAASEYEMHRVAMAAKWCEERGHSRQDSRIFTGHFLKHKERQVEVLVDIPESLTAQDEERLSSQLEGILGCSAAVRAYSESDPTVGRV